MLWKGTFWHREVTAAGVLAEMRMVGSSAIMSPCQIVNIGKISIHGDKISMRGPKGTNAQTSTATKCFQNVSCQNARCRNMVT